MQLPENQPPVYIVEQHHRREAVHSWTDDVFAGGKRIAKADSFKDEIALQGNNTAAGQYTWWGITGTPNVTVRTGDKLFFYHLQQGAAEGGMILTFSDGTNTGWAAQDQDGNYANVGTIVDQWHSRTVDLSAYAGKTINQFLVGNSSAASTGAWNAWYSDIAVASADGTVTPIYTGQTSTGFQFVSTSSPLASNLSASVTHDSTVGANTVLTTSYYHGDQIGSSRLMTAGTGWPIWQGTFLPFGEEYSPQISTNHYKFTGKERDAESGLDYFGARYYGSALGRFITSDWSAVPIPVPYADFIDPQSLNQYSYVRNIPSTRVDPDGHCCDWLDSVGNFVSAGLNAWGSDNLGGAGRMEQTTTSGKVSQFIGDLGATIQGGLETTVSAGGELLGAGMDGTVVLAPEGLAVNILSTAGLIHGSGTTATAGTNLMKDVTGESSGSSSSSAVDKTVETIDKGGFEVKANPKKPGQEGNVTITHPEEPGVKLNVRTETHPVRQGGQPVRHVNVERVEPGPKNRPIKKSNTHITE